MACNKSQFFLWRCFDIKQELPINGQIREKEVQLIGVNGEKLGVVSIREALDKAGFVHIPIMSYSVKYASTFYGPFREAANSAPSFGDRKAYQMDPANTNEALIEAELDVLEGADILMVKPALSYLDVIRRVKDNYNLPLAAYNVSGEYAMLKSAVKNGILSEGAIYESILSIKRAGADIIITYFAKDLAKMIRDNK